MKDGDLVSPYNISPSPFKADIQSFTSCFATRPSSHRPSQRPRFTRFQLAAQMIDINDREMLRPSLFEVECCR